MAQKAEEIGTGTCPTCKRTDAAILQSRGRNQRVPFLMMRCPDCGTHQPRGAKGQEWLRAQAGITPPPAEPAPADPPAADPEPQPRPRKAGVSAGGLAALLWNPDE